jgi:hypothetical protein
VGHGVRDALKRFVKCVACLFCEHRDGNQHNDDGPVEFGHEALCELWRGTNSSKQWRA